jgi:hypothetical protein
MQAIKAIFDGNTFIPRQPLPVDGIYEVLITFIEPINAENIELRKPVKLPRSTAKGFLKDKVWMSKDFNEPLDDLKEYMGGMDLVNA